MRKIFLSLAVLFTFASCAFGDITKDLFKAAGDPGTNPKIISKLVKLGGQIHARNNFEHTPFLHAALNNPNPEILKALLKAGANLRDTDYEGKTALILAATYGHADVVKFLIDSGLDVNAKDQHGYTALMSAVLWEADYTTANLLISSGADVNAQNKKMHYVLFKGVLRTVEPGDSALMLAARNRTNVISAIDVVNLLLRSGANIYAKNNRDETAYSMAYFNEVKNILVNAMISDEEENSEDNNEELEAESPFNAVENPDMTIEEFNALIKSGFDVNSKDSDGATPLIYAAAYNTNPEIIKALLKAGADINAHTINGDDAFIIAAGDNPNPEILRVLLNAGANLKTTNNQLSTALMASCQSSNIREDVVKFLIDSGIDINAQDKYGMTALIYASMSAESNIVKLLLSSGADVNIKDNEGKNALDYSSGDDVKKILSEAMKK